MFKDTPHGCLLRVKVKPERPKARVAEITDSLVLIELKSKPVENNANEELVSFLKKIFRANVEIVGGHKSRLKRVFVYGLNSADCSARLLEFLNR